MLYLSSLFCNVYLQVHACVDFEPGSSRWTASWRWWTAKKRKEISDLICCCKEKKKV
jgi:hypothetical protein